MSPSNIRVPDDGSPDSKLWILGEAPGEEEEYHKKPFVGPSGKLLDSVLSLYSTGRESIFISNMYPYRPQNNNFELIRGSLELKQNVARLKELAAACKPNCILVLGNNALSVFTQYKGISAYRGSILESNGIKLIPSYHPAGVLREYGFYPIFAFDVNKAIEESKFPEFNYPVIDIVTNPSDVPVHVECSVDIECTKKTKELLCIGFGYNNTATVLEFNSRNDIAIRHILSSHVSKIFHNGCFDVNMLRLKGYIVNGYTDDTIVQAHLLEPELPRSLAYLNSIHTRLPYYKQARAGIPEDEKSWGEGRTREELMIYNAKDVWVTYQVFTQQRAELKERGLMDLYAYEMDATLASVDISQAGMQVDEERRILLQEGVLVKVIEAQKQLNKLAGYHVNPRSPKDVPQLLYDDIGLPIKKDRLGHITTNEDALIALMSHCQTKIISGPKKDELKHIKGFFACNQILALRGWLKLDSSYFSIKLSADNRARSIFKAHATETGRWSASKFVDDTGLNLQTVPRGEV